MTSSRQYLIRALYDWIVDNNCTPYILVNALADEVDVPRQFVKDGQIVLNVSPSAIVGFLVDNEAVSFNGRFGGVPTAIYVPVSAVMGIYARENGQGMVFDLDDSPEPPKPKPDGTGTTRALVSSLPSARPSLKVVK